MICERIAAESIELRWERDGTQHVYWLGARRLGHVARVSSGTDAEYFWDTDRRYGPDGRCGSLRTAKRNVEQNATEEATAVLKRRYIRRLPRKGATRANYQAIQGEPLDVAAICQLVRDLRAEGIDWSPVEMYDHPWGIPRRYINMFTLCCGRCLVAADEPPKGMSYRAERERRARLEKLARRCHPITDQLKRRVRDDNRI